jgi:hypothetical protein
MSDDGELIGAEAIKEPFFVEWQEKNGMYIEAPELHARGIVSQDGNAVYQLDGKDAIQSENGMVAIIIDECEYNECIEKLGDLDDVPEQEDTPEENTEDVETPMNAAQMRKKITELNSAVEMLTECILEMSEAVYND